MSSQIQQALNKLKSNPVSIQQWKGKPNEWLTKLPNATAGKVGEKLVCAILLAKPAPKGSTFDLVYEPADSKKEPQKLEVKLCRRSYSGSNVWGWKQIRPKDDWDWMCLIAVEPDETFLFVVPREILLAQDCLSNQHGKGSKAGTLMQLVFSDFPDWLKKYRIQ